MKRIDIVTKLLKEGFSEKTLANLSDKQLKMLSDRILAEQAPLPVINVSKTDMTTQNALRQQKKPFATYESEMTEDEDGEKPKFKSKTEWLKSKGIIKDDDKKEKTEEEGKKEEPKETIAHASQPVSKPGDGGVDLTEWVKNVVGKNIHPFTSKNEIMGLIEAKLHEQEVAEPPVKHVDPYRSPELKKNYLPDFLTYDEIKGAEVAEPAEPKVKPRTNPGEPLKKPRKGNPYQPGPGINPNPKAEKLT